MQKTIVFAHQKGGVGKTTIASSIAVEFAKKGKTAVIDNDNRQQSLSLFISQRKENGSAVPDLYHFDHYEDMLDMLEENKYDFVVIDCGGVDSDVNRVAIASADVLIVPVKPNMIESAGLVVFEENLREIEKNLEQSIVKPVVLLNRVHPRATKVVASFKEMLGKYFESFQIFESVIRARTDIENAFEAGKSVAEFSGAKSKKEFKNFMKELENACK